MTFSASRQSVSRRQVRAAGAVDTAPTALGSQEPILPRFLESIHTGVDIFSTGEHRIHELYVTVECLRADDSAPVIFGSCADQLMMHPQTSKQWPMN
ncbi:MAG: hypothetical protein AAGF54_08195 [Pseudomonadota bacterium]